MATMQNPSSFFSGGGTISGDVELEGRFDLNQIVIGLGAEALDDATAVGLDAEATGNEKSAAFGRGSQATGGDATALGTEAKATNRWNTVAGYDAGSQNNGRNIVLIGRQATATGDNAVAIGEISAADGQNSTAIGRGTEALGDDSAVFGQASTVTGVNSTVVGQGVTVDAANSTSIGTGTSITGDRAVGVGANSTASGDDSIAFGESATANALGATAIGSGATASGVNALAVGTGSTASRDQFFSFGDRNVNLEAGRSFQYTENAGIQTIINIPVTSDASDGDKQAYSFDIGGEAVFQIEGEADGAGGVKNKIAKVVSSFDFRGASDDAVDVITGNISIRDGNGNEELKIDATSDPPTIDFKNNGVEGFSLRNSESLTFQADAGAQTITDIPVSAAPDNSEQSYTFAIGGNDIAKVIALGDGTGGVKEPEFQLLDILNANGNNIEDGSDVIYNTSESQIEQSILENSSLTYTAGDGLGGGGNVALGGSATFNIGAGSFITTNNSSIEVNIGSGIEGDGTDNIRVRGDAVSDGFLSEGTDPHQISVNLGSGLEGDGVNNIRVSGGSIAGNVLSEGTNPHQVDLNIGNGVTQSGDQIIADSDTFITVGNSGISVNITNGLEGDGADSIRVSGGDIADGFLSEGSNPYQLSVNLGNGVESDGSNNIRVNPAAIAGNGLIEDTTTQLGIAADAIQSSELDTADNYNFTALQTFTRTPGTGSADIVSFTDGDESNELRFHLDSNGDFRLRAFDNAASTVRDMLRVDPTIDELSVASTLSFPELTGTPTFSDHTHGEGGLTQIPNAGIVNSEVTLTGGDGIKNGGTVSLGSSLTIDIEPADFAGSILSDDGSDNLQLNLGNGVEGDGSDNLRVDGSTVADGFLSQGTNPYNLSVNLSAGLEDDGTNSIRVQGDAVADGFLSEGTSSHQLSVNVSRGLEGDGANNIRVDEDVGFDFTSQITFSSGLDTTADIVDTGTVIYNSSQGYIEQTILENDTVTLNTTNGLSAGSVSLGGSVSIGISGPLQLDTDLQEPGGNLIWDNTNNYIPQPRLENDTVTYTAGDGISSAGSVALGGSSTISADPSSFITVAAGGISVNIDRGLTGDGNDNIQVDESTAFSFTSEITTNSGLNTSGDIRSGTLTIYDNSANEINQDALANSTVGVQAGDGLTGGSSSLSLGDSITLSIPDSGIGTRELDLSFTPTYTNTHTFNGGIIMGSQIDMQGSNKVVNLPQPDDPGDSANKEFVEGVAQGLNLKASSAAATDGTNIDLTSTTDPNPIDGFTLSDGQRVLLKDQTDATENGIYDANTATDPSTWTRSDDFDEDSEVESGAFTFVREGDANGSVSFTVVSPDPISVGSDPIEWAEFATAGAIDEGTSINISGQTISVDVPSLAGTNIEENDNNLRIASTAAGDGLTGGGASAIDVTVSDFAGSGIIDDGTNDLALDTPFTDLTTLVGSPVSVGAQLNLGGDVQGVGGTTTIYDSNSDHVPLTALEADTITINTTNGLSAGSVTLGSSVSIGVSGAFTLDSDLQAVNGEVIWDEANTYIPQGRLENDSITISGGDGLKGGSTASLGGSFGLDIEPQDFAGSGLQDDGSDNLELVNNSITLNAGDGLKNGSTATLGGSFSLDIEPADFAGQFIADDGADDLAVQISDGLEADGTGNIRVSGSGIADQFTSEGANPYQISVNIGSGLEGDGVNNIRVRADEVAGNALVEGNNPYQIDVDSNSIGSSELVNDSVTVSSGDGLKNGGSVSLGSSISLDIEPFDFAGSGLEDDGSDNLQLVNDSVTVSTGFGVSGGTTISLGGSTTLSVDIAEGLEGDGANSIRVRADQVAGNALVEGASPYIIDVDSNSIGSSELVNDSITVSSGNGLAGGGTASLGGSTSLSVDASSFISSGTGGVSVNIGTGLTGDGSDNIIVDESTAFTFTSQIQFSGGLDTRGDIVDSGTTIYDTSAGHVPSSILQASDITVSGNNGLSGGTASLGGSLSVGISGNLSLDSDLVALNGEVIWDESAGYIPQAQFENDSITINSTAVSLGSSISIALSDLTGFDLSGNSLSDGTTTIYDSTNGFVPVSALEASSVTVNTGTGISGGGSPSLGGTGIDISLTNTDITINTSNGLTGGTVSLGGSVNVEVSGSFELDTDLVSNTNGSNNVIYDESEAEINTSVLPDPFSVNRLNANIIGDNGASQISFNISGIKRAQVDDSGNLDIEGSLTEGAAL